jgi:hypothetical protein
MHFERLLVNNLRGVANRELDFTIGLGRLRRWTLHSADPGSSFFLYALALAGLGQRQMQRLDPQSLPRSPERLDCPAHLEVVQVRHALQERGATSPSRRHLGWAVDAKGRFCPLPKSMMRHHDPAAPFSRPELGQSNVGRLVLG